MAVPLLIVGPSLIVIAIVVEGLREIYSVLLLEFGIASVIAGLLMFVSERYLKGKPLLRD